MVLPSRYLHRNPHLAFSETVQDCPADLAPEPLAGHGRRGRLYPISANITTADSHAGTFTAACGVIVYRGGGLPAQYRGGAFSCDPTGNLVHFDGSNRAAQRSPAGRSAEKGEFLASSDNWFRPVFLASGPEEALYICDMYRKTIEHPDYLPAEIRKRTDFESGRGMGRIWRDGQRSSRAARYRRPAPDRGASGGGHCFADRAIEERRPLAHRPGTPSPAGRGPGRQTPLVVAGDRPGIARFYEIRVLKICSTPGNNSTTPRSRGP